MRVVQVRWWCAGLALLAAGGCASARRSETARTGVEQLLISNAIDQALAKIDFRPLDGRSVFLEEKYLEGVDKSYLLASFRHRALRAGAQLVDKVDNAELVVELRSGGIGTDGTDSFVGIPGMTIPPMIALPEIRLFSRTKQIGTAKIGIVAYDAKTKTVIGEGAVSRARAVDDNVFAFGVGPWNRGSIQTEVKASELPNDFPLEAIDRPQRAEHSGSVQQAVFMSASPIRRQSEQAEPSTPPGRLQDDPTIRPAGR